MKRQLEENLSDLRAKLAALDRKIQNQPGSRYLKDIRYSYKRAIASAESTLARLEDFDPLILETVARGMKS